ncbi:class I SAM-dependent methyltransferase [Neobacillus cucumis]|uniref:SAM-dependent methyltransferase n=1 Tax=Neobacillus cucumis TaxID=1740721 RepID=A0A2N5HBB2_9BACI|nr:methyltransferase domain-containing protein [Neobacillus cucumis]PLS02798.1 SAM-dependent methyltransferase [Neobacillus cucumis]
MDLKKDVQQQFGKSADSYVSSSIHKDGMDLQKLIEMAKIIGNEVLLDIATGGGHTANAFAPLVKNVIAMDLTQEMLLAAEKFVKGNGNQNVHFVKGDAENLPFSNDSFDIVTCRIAPHHFPNINDFNKEVFRVLKQGGQFLLDDNVVPEDNEFDQFYNKIEKWRDYSHFRAWKKSEWICMLESVGFEIVEWHRFEKTFYFDSWCNRMNLPADEKKKLTEFILGTSERVLDKFRVTTEKGRVLSFQGEAIVLKATKK